MAKNSVKKLYQEVTRIITDLELTPAYCEVGAGEEAGEYCVNIENIATPALSGSISFEGEPEALVRAIEAQLVNIAADNPGAINFSMHAGVGFEEEPLLKVSQLMAFIDQVLTVPKEYEPAEEERDRMAHIGFNYATMFGVPHEAEEHRVLASSLAYLVSLHETAISGISLAEIISRLCTVADMYKEPLEAGFNISPEVATSLSAGFISKNKTLALLLSAGVEAVRPGKKE